MICARPEKDEIALAAIANGKPIMLFDGICNLCSGSVRFAIARDPAANLRFAPIQSALGQDFLRRRGLPTDQFETFYLIDNDASSRSLPEFCAWPDICVGRGRS